MASVFSPLIDELISSLRCLPGVGPKSAQRMVLHLLEHNRDGAARLARSLEQAIDGVGRCQRCRTLTEQPVCGICENPRRDGSVLCVVETPADVVAIEQAGGYQGKYFVLLGRLSPIDGIGPEDIGIDQLVNQLKTGAVSEVILATNPTMEGETTAFYISERAKDLGVTVSRIAHGVPLGGELEFVDGGTLAHAFSSRKAL
ncbi:MULTISPECIES: recombination mediator RecR [Marinimicrobium]|jgi:recombination protein RecR|uniref:Recombination protein RecR n=1 Tax=Marinimicrobium koreense TaxID=306545 RepID=A0A3N1NVY6_9GAMM|nr:MULTISPECIES: recombination mediator RecR [Marinimicrobium]MAN50689.1 recombination protein RecR [Marinimicrobium sp.]ROQ19611.1 DNA replication and repair protein RecR [Marinimicrobium koreense]|tara:strand:+ start:723 stop:1325 length:603 start_codon:yes stop_codon:yes gene_type:complete